MRFAQRLFVCAFFISSLAYAGDPAAAIGAARQALNNRQFDQAVKLLQDAVPDAANLAEPQRTQALAALHFYTALAFNGMKNTAKTREELEQFFTFTPNAAKLDPAKYDAAFIKAFDETRASVAQMRSSSFEAAYPNYRAFADAEPRPRPLAEWGESPELQLLGTAEEKDAWKKAKDDDARRAVVDAFWKARGDDYRRAFLRRVAFADQAFVTERTRGSLTDRGRVFVLLGPPPLVRYSPLTAREGGGVRTTGATNQQVAAAADSRGEQQNWARMAAAEQQTAAAASSSTPLTGTKGRVETWVYGRDQLPKSVPDFQVPFRFVTEEGYGDSVLQRDSIVLKTLHDAGVIAQ